MLRVCEGVDGGNSSAGDDSDGSWDGGRGCDGSVLLSRGDFQGIKRMKKLTMYGLFLTCTQEFNLYIYIKHNQLFGHNPSHQK